jgi:hypothetical protein
LNLADLMIVCPHRKPGTLPPEAKLSPVVVIVRDQRDHKAQFFRGLLRIEKMRGEKMNRGCSEVIGAMP